MEESSSETQPRCPCGFWGSAKTLGLCSTCYRKAHRTQSQGNSLAADAGKGAVGTCHNQSPNNTQGKKMDSRHFPSRSTTDNLPSSLSSPPGERAALTAASSSAMDATTPTTSGGTTTPSHIPNVMSTDGAGGDIGQSSATVIAKSSPEPLTSTSETDTCSSASSDPSYDPKRDKGHLSDSCTSLISAASSSGANLSVSATSILNDECPTLDSLAVKVKGSTAAGVSNAATNSISSTQSSLLNSTRVSGTSADTVSDVISSNIASSSKNSPSKNVERGEKPVATSSIQDASPRESASNSPAKVNTDSKQLASASDAVSPASSRGVKRTRDEMETSNEAAPAQSPQKNKKRCFICSCKLELAQRTIGRCRCDRIFCALHRLPELHECDFNHKEDGRREAREKMVKPTRHLGPSYRREDHHS